MFSRFKLQWWAYVSGECSRVIYYIVLQCRIKNIFTTSSFHLKCHDKSMSICWLQFLRCENLLALLLHILFLTVDQTDIANLRCDYYLWQVNWSFVIISQILKLPIKLYYSCIAVFLTIQKFSIKSCHHWFLATLDRKQVLSTTLKCRLHIPPQAGWQPVTLGVNNLTILMFHTS